MFLNISSAAIAVVFLFDEPVLHPPAHNSNLLKLCQRLWQNTGMERANITFAAPMFFRLRRPRCRNGLKADQLESQQQRRSRRDSRAKAQYAACPHEETGHPQAVNLHRFPWFAKPIFLRLFVLIYGQLPIYGNLCVTSSEFGLHKKE